MIAAVEVLGVESIGAWRFYRTFKAVQRLWHRLFWRTITRRLVLLTVSGGDTLAEVFATTPHIRCVSCGVRLWMPSVPAGPITRATFGCGRCLTYYYADLVPSQHANVYDTIRQKLAGAA